MSGRVVLVGAGPGAPDLLTVRAVDALRIAEVVMHDRLVGEEILELVSPAAEVIDVGKHPGDDRTQDGILLALARHARAGRNVVRLKGGDPMVFGRGGEEILYLARLGITAEVVPGISSAIGVPTSIGLPVTLRGVATGFAVVAGRTLTPADWARYVGVDTLVILMGAGSRRTIAASLIEAGRPPSEMSAFVESGTTLTERVTLCSLSDIAAGAVDVNPPVVWVTGPVVKAMGAAVQGQVEQFRGLISVGAGRPWGSPWTHTSARPDTPSPSLRRWKR